VLTGAGGRASKRSLIVRFTVSGQVPCSGAERRGKVLAAVSAGNKLIYSFRISPYLYFLPLQKMVRVYRLPNWIT